MATLISDTACVDPKAELEDGVEVGPYCVVGAGARLGRGTRLIGHAYVLPGTVLGRENVVHPFAVLGGEPQDATYRGGPTRLEVGDGNIFREGVTVNRAGHRGEGLTRIGSGNHLMAGAHVAHDCQLGDGVAMANGATLGAGVRVDDHATLSAGAAVHPRVTIGAHSFVGPQTRVYHDVPPFLLVDGSPTRVRCINVVALKRSGRDRAAIEALHEAHRLIYRGKTPTPRAAEILRSHGQLTDDVRCLIAFIEAQHAGRHGRARERPEPAS